MSYIGLWQLYYPTLSMGLKEYIPLFQDVSTGITAYLLLSACDTVELLGQRDRNIPESESQSILKGLQPTNHGAQGAERAVVSCNKGFLTIKQTKIQTRTRELDR